MMMKQKHFKILSILILLCTHLNITAREINENTSRTSDSTGIAFLNERMEFSEILNKAKTENKLVFLDAYTTWCGPCKWMDKNIFTHPEVAIFFNTNFINAKFDMEKGEGLELVKKYDIAVYPTYLFLDHEGEIVHRMCGSTEKDDFLDWASKALNDDQNLRAQKEKFNSGNNDLDFLKNYLLVSSQACQPDQKALVQFLDLVKDKDLLNTANWPVVKRYLNDIYSPHFQFILKNYNEILVGDSMTAVVEDFIDITIYYRLNGSLFRKDSAQLERDKNFLNSLNLPITDKMLLKFEIVESRRSNDWNKLITDLTHFQKTYATDRDKFFINDNSQSIYQNVDDKEILAKTIIIMEQLLSLKENHIYYILRTYASLLLKVGRIEEGKAAAREALKAGKENDEIDEIQELLKKYQE